MTQRRFAWQGDKVMEIIEPEVPEYKREMRKQWWANRSSFYRWVETHQVKIRFGYLYVIALLVSFITGVYVSSWLERFEGKVVKMEVSNGRHAR